MHGIAEALLQLLFYCLVAAFIIELVINRRPIVVALFVPFAAFIAVAIWAGATMGFSDVRGMSEIFLAIMFFGFLASLIGSGTARGLRLWIDLRREETTPED